jgi:hypothetical protein
VRFYAQGMRWVVGAAGAAVLLAACAAGSPVVKPIEEVDLDSWRADIVAWPSAPSDPDMAEMYQTAVADCDNSVDDLTARMGDPAVDPTLVLVGVSYVCPGEQQKVAEAMRELHNAKPGG